MELVTVATFSYEPEAQLAKETLRAHGIEAFLADDNIVSIDPLATLAYHGVKVQVPDSMVEEAREILGGVPEEDLPPRANAHDEEPVSQARRSARASFNVVALALGAIGLALASVEAAAGVVVVVVLAALGTWAFGRLGTRA